MITVLTLSSCSSDKFQRELLCDNLHSRYTAKADFIITDGEKNTIGEVDIKKGEGTSIRFLLPEEFCGISVTGDIAGNSDTFCFEYEGIPASVPKALTSRLSLMFSLISDGLSSHVENLPQESFAFTSNPQAAGSISEEFANVSFNSDGINYCITYNTVTGLPCVMNAGNDKLSVCLTFKDINIYNKN